MTLNVTKSNFVVFDSRKNSNKKQPVKLFISHEELEQKDFAKYLGFILINSYHGLSTMKSQTTNFIKELVF